jgi:hypothetical protein
MLFIGQGCEFEGYCYISHELHALSTIVNRPLSIPHYDMPIPPTI